MLIYVSFAPQAGSVAGDSYTEEQTDVDDATAVPSPGGARPQKCLVSTVLRNCNSQSGLKSMGRGSCNASNASVGV